MALIVYMMTLSSLEVMKKKPEASVHHLPMYFALNHLENNILSENGGCSLQTENICLSINIFWTCLRKQGYCYASWREHNGSNEKLWRGEDSPLINQDSDQ